MSEIVGGVMEKENHKNAARIERKTIAVLLIIGILRLWKLMEINNGHWVNVW